MANNLSEMITKEGHGSLPRENFGLASLNVDEMQGTTIPMDYDITETFGDIIMVQIVDEVGDGMIKRDGIIVNTDVTRKVWRVGKITVKGPGCTSNISVGDLVMYPSDRGIPMIGKDKKKYIFLNEPRLFCKVIEKGTTLPF